MDELMMMKFGNRALLEKVTNLENENKHLRQLLAENQRKTQVLLSKIKSIYDEANKEIFGVNPTPYTPYVPGHQPHTLPDPAMISPANLMPNNCNIQQMVNEFERDYQEIGEIVSEQKRKRTSSPYSSERNAKRHNPDSDMLSEHRRYERRSRPRESDYRKSRSRSRAPRERRSSEREYFHRKRNENHNYDIDINHSKSEHNSRYVLRSISRESEVDIQKTETQKTSRDFNRDKQENLKVENPSKPKTLFGQRLSKKLNEEKAISKCVTGVEESKNYEETKIVSKNTVPAQILSDRTEKNKNTPKVIYKKSNETKDCIDSNTRGHEEDMSNIKDYVPEPGEILESYLKTGQHSNTLYSRRVSKKIVETKKNETHQSKNQHKEESRNISKKDENNYMEKTNDISNIKDNVEIKTKSPEKRQTSYKKCEILAESSTEKESEKKDEINEVPITNDKSIQLQTNTDYSKPKKNTHRKDDRKKHAEKLEEKSISRPVIEDNNNERISPTSSQQSKEPEIISTEKSNFKKPVEINTKISPEKREKFSEKLAMEKIKLFDSSNKSIPINKDSDLNNMTDQKSSLTSEESDRSSIVNENKTEPSDIQNILSTKLPETSVEPSKTSSQSDNIISEQAKTQDSKTPKTPSFKIKLSRGRTIIRT